MTVLDDNKTYKQMENLGQIKSDTTWNEASSTLNANFKMIQAQFNSIGSEIKMPWFKQVSDAYTSIPYPYIGQMAAVGLDFPLSVYSWNGEEWTDTGLDINEPSVTMTDYYTKEQVDALVDSQVKVISTQSETDLWLQIDALSSYDKCGYYILKILNGYFTVGTLFVFSNNGGHVVNQILFSCYELMDGKISGGSMIGHTTICSRSFNISVPNHPAPIGQWTDWDYIATYPNELNPGGGGSEEQYFNVAEWSGIEVNGVTVQSASSTASNGKVVYDTYIKSFLYLVTIPTGDMYYSNWSDRSKYQDNVYVTGVSTSFSAGFKKNTLYVGTEKNVVMIATDEANMQKIVDAQDSNQKRVAFAGVFTGSSDDIIEGTPTQQKVYFLQEYGYFGIGEVTESNTHYEETDGFKRFKFTGQIGIGSGTEYDNDYDTSQGVLLPKENTVYYIDGRGMDYDIKTGASGFAVANPKFTLRRGDCLLKDGTFAFKEDAVSNHLSEIAGIIIDPIKKMMIPVPMDSIGGSFVGASSFHLSALNKIKDILAVADDAIAFDMAMYSMKDAIGLAYFKSYFPAFYSAHYENSLGYKRYLGTRKECTIAGEDEDVQYVITQLNQNNGGTIGNVFYGASPMFAFNDLTSASSLALEGDVTDNYKQSATATNNTYLIVALYK